MKRVSMLIVAGLLGVIMACVIPAARAQDMCADGEWLIDGACTALAGAALTGDWHTVQPGGDTRCGLDTPYQFWVRPGSDEVLIYLPDGGFCTDGASCQREDVQWAVEPDGFTAYRDGIFAHDNPANPFRDYTVLVAPPCTGDLFIGDQLTVYSDDLSIHHRGRANLDAVLTFAREVIAEPDTVFVAGTGTSSLASALAATTISETIYPGRAVVQLGSMSALPFSDPADLQAAWNARGSLTTRATIPAAAFVASEFYPAVSRVFSRVTYAQVIPASAPDLAAQVGSIALAAPGFRYARVDEDDPALLTDPAFYTALLDGQSLVAWVTALAAGEPVENVPPDQATANRAFIRAIEAGDAATVQTLLDAGADPNMATFSGRQTTVLLLATSLDYVDVVEVLLDSGADILTLNRRGYNAFHLAAQQGNPALVAVMLPVIGADIDRLSDSEYGANALHSAAAEGHIEVVRLLLDHGADINRGDKYGDPALNWAAYYGHTEVVRLLIERGVDVNNHSDAGNSALATAQRRGHQEIVDLLVAAGAE